ncbi:MAG: hypothetical protein PHS96_02950 [Anaerolineales bacterium]|nr:hypothetical protein [Anaerolineales bacterium]
MDKWDYIDNTQRSRKRFTVIWNLLTILMLLATVCVVAVFLSVFIDPHSALNLFPPPTLPPAIALPTLTPTPRQVLPPTWTPLPSITPTSLPTPTLAPTETPFPLFTPSATPEATVSSAGLPFDINAGSPVAISSVAFHPEVGCNWMGVAGQVLNMSGAPVSTGVVIKLGGSLGGVSKEITSLTGTARQYGDAGYEIVLASKPIASLGTLWLQLLDQAGLPMSPKIHFDTFEACDKNLIFINFRQVR